MSDAPEQSAPESVSGKWRARWAAAIADQSISPQAKAIADSLLHDAQEAVMYGAPWQLEMTDPVKWELALCDLLDEEMAALNGLGIQVKRCLARRDLDWSRRDEEYLAWFDRYYADAYYCKKPGHAGLHAALFLDPDAHEPLLDIAASRAKGVLITNPEDVSIAVWLAGKKLATMGAAGVTRRSRQPVYRVEPTELGRTVAFHIGTARDKRAAIFEGAKRSIPTAWDGVLVCCGMELLTGFLGQSYAAADREARA